MQVLVFKRRYSTWRLIIHVFRSVSLSLPQLYSSTEIAENVAKVTNLEVVKSALARAVLCSSNEILLACPFST